MLMKMVQENNQTPCYLSNLSNTILFAGDTNTIVTNHSPGQFKNNINKVFGNINDRFRINLLSLISDNTLFTIHSHKINMNISYENKLLILIAPNFLDYLLIVLYHGITILINQCLNKYYMLCD
jgi:hypothetical protein